jgi:hypothetical protein
MRRLISYLPAFIPAAFTLLLIAVWLRGNLYSYLPTNSGVYNDGAFYFREMTTFKWVSMNGGYYTLNEQPAAAPYTRFYAHGPGFAVVYGTFAKLVSPIYPQTIIVFHLIGVTVGLLIYLYFAQLWGNDLLWFCAYVITAWGLLFYLPSAMQEGMQMTIGCILAGLAFPIIRDRSNAPLWVKITFGVFAGAAALTRPSWAFLLLPYAILIQPSRSWQRTLFAIVVAGLAIGGLTAVYFYQAAPWPLEYLQASLETNPILRFAKSRLEMTIRNLASIFEGDGVTLLVRWETICLIILSGLVLLREGQIRRRLQGRTVRIIRSTIFGVHEALFHLLNLGMIFGVVLMFYVFGSYGHDFRLFEPHRLISVLLLIAFKRWKIVALIIAINVVMIPTFLDSYYNAWHSQFLLNRPQVRAFFDEIKDVFPYDPDAPSGWCNTILIGIDVTTSGFPPEILTFPFGIGISFYIDPKDVAQPPKSHYLLLDETQIDSFSQTRLSPLKETRIGTFYENLDAGC